MKFDELLAIVQELPLFHSGLLLAGTVDPADVQRQLVRWVAAGRIVQLRRCLYALAAPYARVRPDPFLVANTLQAPSYVSCQSALAYHGLIPEAVPAVVSVTTRRSGRHLTPFGAFQYRHIQPQRFRGFERLNLPNGQAAFVATPEKALLDLIALEPGADHPDSLEGLRLQHLDLLDVERLKEEAALSGAKKLERAAAWVTRAALEEQEELMSL